jgi:hypothetical protein
MSFKYWLVFALIGGLVGGAASALATPSHSDADLARGSLCVRDDVSVAIADVAVSEARAQGHEVTSETESECGQPTAAVLRPGFDPLRPELSAPPAQIVRATEAAPPRVVVRRLPSGVDPGAYSVTGGIVASAFACSGDSCAPSEMEVYVFAGDSSVDIRTKVRRALGYR